MNKLSRRTIKVIPPVFPRTLLVRYENAKIFLCSVDPDDVAAANVLSVSGYGALYLDSSESGTDFTSGGRMIQQGSSEDIKVGCLSHMLLGRQLGPWEAHQSILVQMEGSFGGVLIR